jgi:PAS domain S-box-containing protein
MNSLSVTPTDGPTADAYLAAIIDSSFDAIISKDLNSVITTWNAAAERMFGYSSEEAVGQSILILIPENRRGEETEIIHRVRRGERVSSYETVRHRKDGSPVHVSLTISPIRSPDGLIVGASKIARDITAAKENERRIRILMRELNHRVKNQFAVLLSMIRETSRRTSNLPEFERVICERIMALARSHDLLVNTEWSGADLAALIREQLQPFGHEERIEIRGPALTLPPDAIQPLGMALHELGTNSAKYGALSANAGKISVSWQLVADSGGNSNLNLVWDEAIAPSDFTEDDTRKGFGSVVLNRVTPVSLNGVATLKRSEQRVLWTLSAPIGSDD